MCELFAMSSRQPTTINFSLDALAKQGSSTGPYKDGWGVGYYEDNDVRLIREAGAAGQSDWVQFIEAHDLRSHLVISHIRHATVGKRALRNTQPFCRELGGRMHMFAHNGDLRGIAEAPRLHFGVHRPIGETDSEYAFCALLARLEGLWLSSNASPALVDRFEIVTEFAAALRPLGPANFLYADGDILFAHGHRRRHEDDLIRPPGLCLLRRHCPTDSPARHAEGVKMVAEGQDVVLIASVPLTDEAWSPLADGEVAAVRDATIVCRAQP